MMLACARCWNWYADEERLEGECRIRAPRLSGQATPHGDATHRNPQRAMWPITNCDDWCGEHSPKEFPHD